MVAHNKIDQNLLYAHTRNKINKFVISRILPLTQININSYRNVVFSNNLPSLKRTMGVDRRNIQIVNFANIYLPQTVGIENVPIKYKFLKEIFIIFWLTSFSQIKKRMDNYFN